MLNKNRKYPVEVILAWTISAENALHTCSGYSRNQLVLGKSPNFSSILTNKPPALKDITHSKLVLEHLNAMHAARKAFIEAESN